MKTLKLLSLTVLIFLFTNSVFAQSSSLPQYNNPNSKSAKQVAAKTGATKPAAKAATPKTTAQIHVDSLKMMSDATLQERLILLKSTLKKSSIFDTARIVALNAEIDTIKILNTDKFLTRVKPPEPYVFTKFGSYNVDTLNKYFYNQGMVSVLQNARVQNFTGLTTYISAELASFLFGPVRMGIGGSFTSSGDTTKDNVIKSSIQKIVSNGGTVNFNFSMPLFMARSQNEQAHFAIYGQTYFGIDPGIDTLGTSTTTTFSKNASFINQTGLIFHADAGSNDGRALLTFELPCYWVTLSHNMAAQIKNIPDSFAIVKLQAGVMISNLIDLHISGALWSSARSIVNSPYVVSIQFSPAQVFNSSSK